MPCLSAVCAHELNFVHPFRLGIRTSEIIIPNGINIDRILRRESNQATEHVTTFLAFGGRNIQKHTDLLMLAADKIVSSGKKIKVIIVGGEEIINVAHRIFGDIPAWCAIVPPVENINMLFAQADCFVSTSVHETFSYAIAEASIYGLPVIQSDIGGTMWNSSNPSAFLFKSGDIFDLSRVMMEVMEYDKSALAERCRITRENNIANYSLDGWADKMIEFFETLP